MKLEFEQLTLSSFKSFDDGDHTIHFERLKPGLHFMRGINRVEPRLGSNGAGKSSIWDGLCWCLYGKTVGGLKNTDITPWGQRKKTASVIVHLRADDEPHMVQRTVGPNRLMVDDKDSGAEDVSSLIGLSFDLFVNTILMGQGEDLFFDLKPAAKMQLFVDVLELDRWDRLSGKASSKVGLILQDQAEVQGELTGIESTLVDVGALLGTAQERAKEWDDERGRSRVIIFD
jgi:DNA repair exonuclease SbcCD ATPase subunit